MKILIFIPTLKIGGTEREAILLSEYLAKQGHQVILLTHDTPATREFSLPRGVRRVDCRAGNTFQMILNIRKAVKEHTCDAVYPPMTIGAVAFYLITFGMKIPPLVVCDSNPFSTRTPLERLLFRMLCPRAKAVIFHTRAGIKEYPKFAARKGTVIPLPLLLDELPKPYGGEREKRFVAVARLVKQKNYPLMLEAFRLFTERHSDWILDIYGEGAEQDNVERLIHSLGLEESVRLNGNVAEILESIRKAGAFVISSDFEGFGIVLSEAMALGLPVITTDHYGADYLIQDHVNGLVVKRGDKFGLAQAMEEIVQAPVLAKAMGEKALEVRHDLDIAKLGPKYEKVFHSVILHEKN